MKVGIIKQGWPDNFNVFQCLNPQIRFCYILPGRRRSESHEYGKLPVMVLRTSCASAGRAVYQLFRYFQFLCLYFSQSVRKCHFSKDLLFTFSWKAWATYHACMLTGKEKFKPLLSVQRSPHQSSRNARYVVKFSVI